jgi:hypothetical protein
MRSPDNNPPLPTLLRVLTFIELLVLAGAGGLLFFLPEVGCALWPWQLAPFNAAFIGAIYLAALSAIALMFFVNRWAPARPVLVAIFSFTVIVLAVSLLNLGRFDFLKWGTYLWFLLYFILPINAAFHIWLYRYQPPADTTRLPSPWRTLLLTISVVLYLYGLCLLIAPGVFSGFWPWPIDAFHGQIYSGLFIAGAGGLYVIARMAARIEFGTAGLAMCAFSMLAILGLLIVDSITGRVDWSQFGTWFWLGALVVGLLAGAVMLLQTRRMPAIV